MSRANAAVPRRGALPAARVQLNGRVVEAPVGISIAALLWREGCTRLHRNLVTGEWRGPFCGMGVCLECEVSVDGRRAVRACLEVVHDQMVVETDDPSAAAAKSDGDGVAAAARGPGAHGGGRG
jgi:predicted molibdopterin-dependent oxidoreductase YjgC